MAVGLTYVSGGAYGWAAHDINLEVLQYLRADGCPVGRVYVSVRGYGRAPRGATVGARERLPVGRGDVRMGGVGRAPRVVAVGASERMPMGQGYALFCER